jgi:protein-export membrane protein SecD
MFSTLKGRFVLLVAVVAFAASAIYANGITFGLDLKGGMHIALGVHDPEGTLTAEARREAVDQNLQILRVRLDEFGVADPTVQRSGEDRIIVELPDMHDQERAREVIQRSAFLEFKLVNTGMEFQNALPRIDRAIAAAIGADTTLVQVQPQERGVEDLVFGRRDTAAVEDTAAAPAPQAVPATRPLSSLLGGTADANEYLVAREDVERVKQYLALPGVADALPRGLELRWGSQLESRAARLYQPLYVLRAEAFLTGGSIVDATAGRDPQFNHTQVNFTLDRSGGRTFSRVTAANINNRLAIVLDTMVQSAPVVQSQIAQHGRITLGAAPMEEARDLALVLRAGALTVPLEILELREVGAQLGDDSIAQGQVAGMIGLVLVVLVMIAYYRFAGILAVTALSLYLVLLLGGLAGLGAALTAPGIAGIILSIGMAVDANVLIFERIREELAAGRTPRAAVDSGFQHAMSAIVDSNLTTLITAGILFYIGTGPVQGFAVTLSIGIIASFFTAVFITRTFFLLYLERKRAAEPISI